MNGESNVESALLIDAKTLAQQLQVSERTLRRLLDSGKLIRPVRLGRNVRWRADEVRKWIAAGCPQASQWRYSPT